eukprot:752200-Ditylum_brightwellii.AAC.1
MGIDANAQVVLAGIVLLCLTAAVVLKMRLSGGSKGDGRDINRIGSNKERKEGKHNHYGRGEQYRIPEAMREFGDRSSRYAELREEYDALLPPDPQRSRQAVQSLIK